MYRVHNVAYKWCMLTRYMHLKDSRVSVKSDGFDLERLHPEIFKMHACMSEGDPDESLKIRLWETQILVKKTKLPMYFVPKTRPSVMLIKKRDYRCLSTEI